MANSSDIAQSDLAELLNVLGMGDHARPQSPHEVFQEALRVLRARVGKPAPDSTRTGAAETATLSPMPPTLDRALFDPNEPNCYLEGNGDWADANSDAVTWLADNHTAIRAALAARPEAPSDAGWRERAARDVLAERRRQVEVEGWTPEHDDAHDIGEMARAAACYALPQPQRHHLDARDNRPILNHLWPWDQAWWKPSDRRRELVKAGALILAEVERLDRSTSPSDPAPSGQAEG